LVLGCLGEPKKNRRLTVEIVSAYHHRFPLYYYPPAKYIRRRWGFGSGQMYKSELRGFGATLRTG